jgi:subtilisin-like proprotein convertase family protein
MKLQHALAFTSIVLDMQQERLQHLAGLPATKPKGDSVPRRDRGGVTKLVAGLLALVLLAATVAPMFADNLHQPRHSAHRQEQKVSTDKQKGRKSKTVTRTFASGDANGAEIAIPAVGSTGDFGPADPYPSTIEVTGFKKARTTDVNLTLRGFSHEFTRDVDVMLVAPNGRNAVVMGDVGASNDAVDVVDLTITLDDEAAAPLSVASDAALTSGAFQPLDNLGPNDADDPDDPVVTAFPEPAPRESGNSALSTFDGIDPNGQWRLFVLDDTDIDAGVIAGGWSLEITAKSKVKSKPKHKRGRRH